jgi:hypothetical protein
MSDETKLQGIKAILLGIMGLMKPTDHKSFLLLDNLNLIIVRFHDCYEIKFKEYGVYVAYWFLLNEDIPDSRNLDLFVHSIYSISLEYDDFYEHFDVLRNSC